MFYPWNRRIASPQLFSEPIDGQRGRGAAVNPAGRYERYRTERLDDGWADAEEPLPPLQTEVTPAGGQA